MENRLTKEARTLDGYLSAYNRYRNRKRSLEQRRTAILREFESPLRAVSADGMPRGSSDGTGCAALSYELDEIDTRIREKIREMERIYVRINGIMEFLPENSTERSILEYRYLDGYGWRRICELEHMSRTPATRYWRKGLYRLLEYARIQEIVREHEEE